MNTYETLFITPPTLAEDEEKSIVDVLSQIVSDGGGTFHANERMGRRRLAYPIQKFEDGVYTRFLYDAHHDVPKELERRLRLSDKVIRSLTVRLERDWAVAAKEQAVRDAARRVELEAEAERKAQEAAAAEQAAAEAKPDEQPAAETEATPAAAAGEAPAEAAEANVAEAPATAEGESGDEPAKAGEE